jgi:hypothetical protein
VEDCVASKAGPRVLPRLRVDAEFGANAAAGPRLVAPDTVGSMILVCLQHTIVANYRDSLPVLCGTKLSIIF